MSRDEFEEVYDEDDFEDDRRPRQRPRREPKRNRRTWLIVVLVGGGLICVFACCGGFVAFGFGIIQEEVELELRDHPVIRAHIGEISSVKMDFMASIANNNDDVWVYDIEGSKEKGRVTLNHVTDDIGNEVFREGTLRLSDGRTVTLNFGDGPNWPHEPTATLAC